MSAWDRLNTPRRRRGDIPVDVDADGRPVHRLCDVCRDPMVVGQKIRHFTCCAAGGGRPGDVCREWTPKRKKGEPAGAAFCSFCGVPADPSAGEQGAAA